MHRFGVCPEFAGLTRLMAILSQTIASWPQLRNSFKVGTRVLKSTNHTWTSRAFKMTVVSKCFRNPYSVFYMIPTSSSGCYLRITIRVIATSIYALEPRCNSRAQIYMFITVRACMSLHATRKPDFVPALRFNAFEMLCKAELVGRMLFKCYDSGHALTSRTTEQVP